VLRLLDGESTATAGLLVVGGDAVVRGGADPSGEDVGWVLSGDGTEPVLDSLCCIHLSRPLSIVE